MTAQDVPAALTVANGYIAARNYRRAEEVLGTALAQNPENPSLLVELARCEHLRGDNVAAEPHARDAMRLNPEAAEPILLYASIVFELGRKREGLDCARRAVAVAPLDHASHYEYARLLATAGDPARALPEATEALRLAPENAEAHNLMGVVYGMLGRREESMAEHREALRLDPGHAQAVSNLAVNRANTRNLRGALAGFVDAAQMDPHFGDEARKNITATVRYWLRLTTAAAWAALWLSVQIERNNEGPNTTQGTRVVAGIGFVVLVILFGWLVRSMPRRLWGPVLRQRESRSLKVYLGLGAAVIALLGFAAVGPPVSVWVLGGALFATLAVSWLAPQLDKI
jgi:Flp pilus assembly protein TadD